MRFTRGAVAAALVAGLGGLTALAQPGGRGMFGGFGGGPAQLINSKIVQKELKIDEGQASKLKEWAREFGAKQREKMRELFQGGNFDREKFGEIMAEQTKEAYKEIATVLKPDQVKRLRQIDTQVSGTRAFATPHVQEALKLTDEQKEKVRDIEQANGKELQELRQEFGFGRRQKGERPDPEKMAEFTKKSAAISKEAMTKLEGVLTADQKTKWKDLTGEAVDVAKIQAEARPQFQRKKKDD
ncbi:MAG TPA: Spy/CpxP family protein refolding chaperone [Fimbriiglobus sp.]|nr:Spy/CpxP family protein refolding chaperone [Fimbriiglobus sp.]